MALFHTGRFRTVLLRISQAGIIDILEAEKLQAEKGAADCFDAETRLAYI